MLKRLVIAACACALSAGCATSSVETASPETDGAVAAASETSTTEGTTTVDRTDRDRIICKRVSKPGSRFTEQVCKPWSEWDAISQDAEQELLRQRRTRSGTSAG